MKDAGAWLHTLLRNVETITIGDVMPTWCFKSTTQYLRDPQSAPHFWYWQIDTQHAIFAITSPKLFPTLDACVMDARENGFRGELEQPDDLAHPAVLVCEEGPYVHAIVQRSVNARSGLHAA